MLKRKKYVASIMVIFMFALSLFNVGSMNVKASDSTTSTLDQNLLDNLSRLMFNEKILRYDTLKQKLQDVGVQKSVSDIKEGIKYISQHNPDRIVSDAGGFITVAGMLRQPINQLSFVGPHNATNNNPDAFRNFTDATRNQWLEMSNVLKMGSRMLDMDLGKPTVFGNPAHYHRMVTMGTTTTDCSASTIRDFLKDNPNDIIFVKFSEFYDQLSMANSGQRWNQMNFYLGKMKNYGLLEQIYNYNGTNADSANITTDINSATLMDMIGQNKRIILLVKGMNEAHMDYITADRGDAYSHSPQTVANGISVSSKDRPNDLLLVEYIPKQTTGGDPAVSNITNDGYRIYEMIEKVNAKTNDVRKVNFTTLDFLVGNQQQGGISSITAVDAVNRVNLQRFGGGWNRYEDKYFYWTDAPLGNQGNITSSLKNTVATKDGQKIGNSQILLDNHYFESLNTGNYENLNITSDFDGKTDVSKYAVYLTGKQTGVIPYNIFGKKNGKWQLLKQDQFNTRPGKTWYIAELGNEGNNIEAVKFEFRWNSVANLRVSEIAVYNNNVRAHESLLRDTAYYIYNENSLKVLATDSNSNKAGANVIQYTGRANEQGQRFKLVPTNVSGHFNIVNGHGLYLDANGDNVYVNSGNGSDSQKWELVMKGYSVNGKYESYEIRNKASGKNLAIGSSNTNDGANAIQYNVLNNTDQRWYFVKSGPYFK